MKHHSFFEKILHCHVVYLDLVLFVYGVRFNFRGERQHHRKEAEEGTHTPEGGGGKHNTTHK